MKKLSFLTLALIILFSAHQVSAVSDKANGNATNNPSFEKRNENSNKEIEAPEVDDDKEAPSVTITQSPENEEWKNHGQYVSSVAKTHPGGKVVSAAAHSQIGKKVKTSATPSVSPSVSPTVNPSITLSPTPTDDPNATPTPSLTETPTPTPTVAPTLNQQAQAIIETIQGLLSSLKDLLNL